ncbi:hypothetical protein ACFVFQ_09255 [Streptomyces sp. NPDC057743]|uniref:hypothetical protein n=1 Tax=Streptomyces sp. NPDC057743 TaxID=3346236 RepID=UPI00369B9C10
MSFGQGGPFGGQGDSTPNWEALADESEARNRRKRWLMIGGGAIAALAVAGIVAAAVITSSGPSDGNPSAHPSTSGQSALPDDKPSFPDVSVPPPPNPQDYISDPKKDTAPLNPDTLFPQRTMVVGEHSYAKTTAASTGDCTAGAQGALVSSLSHNGCKQLLRATYTKGGVAVTIGVAVFDSPAKATAVMNESKPNLMPLPGGEVPANFCQGSKCRMTTNATGRYAYFTIAGFTNGKDVGGNDASQQISRDGGAYAFTQIAQRGKDQAAKAAAEQLKEAERKAGRTS